MRDTMLIPVERRCKQKYVMAIRALPFVALRESDIDAFSPVPDPLAAASKFKDPEDGRFDVSGFTDVQSNGARGRAASD